MSDDHSTNLPVLFVHTNDELTRGTAFPVDGDDLYDFLGVKSQRSQWFERNTRSLGFQDGLDYERSQGRLRQRRGPQTADVVDSTNVAEFDSTIDTYNYSFTVEAAKHICMASRTEMGRRARDYFIDIEKQYKTLQLNQMQVMQAIVERLDASEKARRVDSEKFIARLERLENRTVTRLDEEKAQRQIDFQDSRAHRGLIVHKIGEVLESNAVIQAQLPKAKPLKVSLTKATPWALYEMFATQEKEVSDELISRQDKRWNEQDKRLARLGKKNSLDAHWGEKELSAVLRNWKQGKYTISKEASEGVWPELVKE